MNRAARWITTVAFVAVAGVAAYQVSATSSRTSCPAMAGCPAMQQGSVEAPSGPPAVVPGGTCPYSGKSVARDLDRV